MDSSVVDQWVNVMKDYVTRCLDPSTNLSLIAAYCDPPLRIRLHEAVTFPRAEEEEDTLPALRDRCLSLSLTVQRYLKNISPQRPGEDLVVRRILSLPSVYRVCCPNLSAVVSRWFAQIDISREATDGEVLGVLGKSSRVSMVEVLRIPQEWLESPARVGVVSSSGAEGATILHFAFTQLWKKAAPLLNKKENRHFLHLLLTQVANTLQVRVDSFARQGGCSLHVMIVFLSEVAVVMQTVDCYPFNVVFGTPYVTTGITPTPCTLTAWDRTLLSKISVLYGIGIDKVRHEIAHLVSKVYVNSPRKVEDSAGGGHSVALCGVMIQIAATVRNVCVGQQRPVRDAVMQALADAVLMSAATHSVVPEIDAQYFQKWLAQS